MHAIKKHQPEPDARHDRRWFDQEPEINVVHEIWILVGCLGALALTWAAATGRLDDVARRFLGW